MKATGVVAVMMDAANRSKKRVRSYFWSLWNLCSVKQIELVVIKRRLWNKARMAWMFCTSGLVAMVMPLGRTSRMGVRARAARSTRLSVTGHA